MVQRLICDVILIHMVDRLNGTFSFYIANV